MSVPALSDLIALEKPSQSQRFPFDRLPVEANTLGSRLEKGVCSSRSICSEGWEQNCDWYHTRPQYFSELLQSTANKYGVDCRSLLKTRVVVIRWFFIEMVTSNLSDSLKSKIFDPPAAISAVFLFFQVGTSDSESLETWFSKREGNHRKLILPQMLILKEFLKKSLD